MSQAAAMAFTLEHELGRYEGDQAYDTNPTLDGVTERAYHTWLRRQGRVKRSVFQMTTAERDAIYAVYWRECHANEVPEPADVAHFAFAFNQGSPVAIKVLQRALGVAVDGRVGPITRAALKAADPTILFPVLLCEQLVEYREDARPRAKRPALMSWVSRLVDVWQRYKGGTRG